MKKIVVALNADGIQMNQLLNIWSCLVEVEVEEHVEMMVAAVELVLCHLEKKACDMQLESEELYLHELDARFDSKKGVAQKQHRNETFGSYHQKELQLEDRGEEYQAAHADMHGRLVQYEKVEVLVESNVVVHSMGLDKEGEEEEDLWWKKGLAEMVGLDMNPAPADYCNPLDHASQ